MFMAQSLGCGPLTLELGTITFSDRFVVNSTATHNCNRGYELSGNNNQRTCSMQGWTGDPITCIGQFILQVLLDRELGKYSTYTEGFNLKCVC